MDQEQINQIVETIKTLNLNVDSVTLVQVVHELKPLFYMWMVKDVIENVLFAFGVGIAVYFLTKFLKDI